MSEDKFAGRLKGLIASIKETRAELDFQVRRIDRLDVSTESEKEHLDDLASGYEKAHKYLGILLKYQQGRLER